MNISAKTKYACLAMIELASRYDVKRPVRVQEIGRLHGIPPRFLVQILLQLKGGGLVASTRGAAGGYQLVKPPEQVSLGHVIDVIDGPVEGIESGKGESTSTACKVLLEAWHDVVSAERKMLHDISLTDLLQRVRQQEEQMYHI